VLGSQHQKCRVSMRGPEMRTEISKQAADDINVGLLVQRATK